jgi:predicted nucleotidyltransferase
MNAESDVDFLIRLPKAWNYETYANNYFSLANALEGLLKKRVDLVAEETLSNPYFIESINRNKMQIL